jgi:two-component system OmpR family sensor kinase
MQTLRFRLTVHWVVVLSCLLGLFSLAVYLGLRLILHRYLDTMLWIIAESELVTTVHGPEHLPPVHTPVAPLALPEAVTQISRLVQYRRFPDGQLLTQSAHHGSFDQLELPWHPATAARVAQGAAVFETIERPAAPAMRLISLPGNEYGPLHYVLQIGLSVAPLQATLAWLLKLLLALDGSVLVLTGLGGAFLIRRALLPMADLVQAVERIESQNLHQRLIVPGSVEELARLTAVLNRMLDRLERSFYTQQRFIADASHELRSPLANLRLALELARRRPRTAQEYCQTMDSALEEVDRLVRLVNGLLTLTQADSGHLGMAQEPVPLSALLHRVVAEYQVAATARGIALSLALPEVLVTGDSARLYQLFANLLDNALRHTPAQGRVAVLGELQKDMVRICVADTGLGIAPDQLPHIFERFYRVAQERSRHEGGSGLGLAICQEVVHAHGGSIRMASRLGHGSTCTVLLPLGCGTTAN